MVSTLICIIISLILLSSVRTTKTWMFIMVLLVYLGGVLVLFLYLTTLNPKKNFFFTYNLMLPALFFLTPFYMTTLTKSWMSSTLGTMLLAYTENMYILVFILFFYFSSFLWFLSCFPLGYFPSEKCNFFVNYKYCY